MYNNGDIHGGEYGAAYLCENCHDLGIVTDYHTETNHYCPCCEVGRECREENVLEHTQKYMESL